MPLLAVLLALLLVGVTLGWRRRRVRARAQVDYMAQWRDFHEREFPHIHPAHLPPLKPLKAKRVDRC